MKQFLIIATVVIALAVACGPGPAAPEPTGAMPTQPSALEQMSTTFIGNPPRSRIEAKVRQSFAFYGVEPSEDTFSRAGSTLAALRRQQMTEQGCDACTEMAILDYMIASHVPGVNIDWPEAAGWAAASLAAED